MSETVLLTGATGFVGMELLARIVERDDADVVCLVRAPSDEAAGRLQAVFARLYDEPPAAALARVSALAGDMSAPALGLAAPPIAQRSSSASPDRPLRGGDLLRPAARGGPRGQHGGRRADTRAGAVRSPRAASCAGICTSRPPTSQARRRGQLPRGPSSNSGQGFRNTYEQSKQEAEQALAAAADGLPLVVARPSIIVGDSASGWTSAFNVIYWPMRAF